MQFRLNELKIKFARSANKRGRLSDNDAALKNLAGIHAGESCVIIGNGPSLRIDDLETLHHKHVVTFGCNRINELFDRTDWRPTYYCLSDSTAFMDPSLGMDANRLASDLLSSGIERIFFIESMKKYLDRAYAQNGKILFFRASLVPPFSVKMAPFSREIADSVSDLGTVAASNIQIAAYMGFKTIYVYGIDNTFKRYIGSDDKFHIETELRDYADGITSVPFDCEKDKAKLLPKSEFEAAVRGGYVDVRKFDLGFSICAEYAHENMFDIYNVTRGGRLEIFERKNFDDVFKKPKAEHE